MSQFLKMLRQFFKPREETKEVLREPQGYQVFTRQFDVVVHSYELEGILGPMPAEQKADLSETWTTFTRALQNWRTKAQIAGLEASSEIRAAKTAEDLKNTLVTILVDHSGSMAGQKILLAAATCDVVIDFLRMLGVQFEVLGFTTVEWKGGRSRRLWRQQGGMGAPGRLADTLHIIYKSAKLPDRPLSADLLKSMLRRDLLKENIDGEAIEWAISRQMEIEAGRRIIIVLSDGAPVDDSTLHANDKDILSRHLTEVVSRTEVENNVELIGVGIGFDTSKYYRNSALVRDINDLGTTVIDMLRGVLRR